MGIRPIPRQIVGTVEFYTSGILTQIVANAMAGGALLMISNRSNIRSQVR
jgi:hypothetical protein